MNKIILVFKKEFREIIRDKKSILVLILIPLIMYPLLFSIMSQIITNTSTEKNNTLTPVIAIKEGVSNELISYLKKEKYIIVIDEYNKEKISNNQFDVYMQLKENDLEIIYDGSVNQSVNVYSKLQDSIDKFNDIEIRKYIENNGLDLTDIKKINYKNLNIADVSKSIGAYISTIIPMLLMVTIGLGAVYPSIDTTAGEKERGTLETILSTPISKNKLFLGKYLAVSTITIISAAFNLISMLMVYLIQTISTNVDIGIDISVGKILIMFLMIIPISFFISSITLSACIFAKSFKDAQNLVTPIYLLIMIPTLFTMSPDVNINSKFVFVPLLNVSLAFREIFINSLSIKTISIIFISNFLISIIGLIMVLKIFNAEEVLFANGKGFSLFIKRSKIKKSNIFEPSEILILLGILLVLLIYISPIVSNKNLIFGQIFSQWGLIFLPIVFYAWYTKKNFVQTFNIRKVSVKDIINVIIIAFCCILINILLVSIQANYFSGTENASKELYKQFENIGKLKYLGFLIIALSPAICEELFFRGALLTSFKSKYNNIIVIIMSSLIFALFHFNLYRFLPTFFLGIVLGIVATKKSIILSIIIHLINNSFAFCIYLFEDKVNFIIKTIFNFGLGIPIIIMLFLGSIIYFSSNKNRNLHHKDVVNI